MATLTIDTESQEVIEAVKSLLKKFNVSYNISGEKAYDPEFVRKIKLSEKQIDEGKVVKYEPGTDLWDILNTK
ncbi:DUF2683 family protein [Dyadobacter sp. CY343]|uniref:DUF2683 family protein n=1 Tax=Dyadobacter sp. CY343 TaxID=2907299 RepID=UPI001F325A05|nr:DUF2683 family protein [Dyadobacter sp. CY343]MCE7061143.1 hypothetical protein [Dyadobacter sp. CY343]